MLSIATSNSWPVHQLDVKNAFLHGNLSETVYAQQPHGFIDNLWSSFVCLLNKSLYGLKQAPCTWFLRFTSFLHSLGFLASKSDSSLFVYHKGSSTAYLLLYVDDIILMANNTQLLSSIISSLRDEFAMTDLGRLRHFLGIHAHSNQSDLFLSQKQYAIDLLKRANMSECNPCTTPVDTKFKLSAFAGLPVSDPTFYRSLAGGLQYLTHAAGHFLCCAASLLIHACSPRTTLASCQTHVAIHPWYTGLWLAALPIQVFPSRRLFRCELGWLSGY